MVTITREAERATSTTLFRLFCVHSRRDDITLPSVTKPSSKTVVAQPTPHTEHKCGYAMDGVMTATGATSITMGLRSLSSSRRREASSSSRRAKERDARFGSATRNNNSYQRYAVTCSSSGAAAGAVVAAKTTWGLMGGITATSRGAGSSVGGSVASSVVSRGVVRAWQKSYSPPSSSSSPVVARGAAGAAATAELAGDAAAAEKMTEEEEEEKKMELNSHWKNAMPANDAIDKQILKLFIPAMLNFLIIPLVGAVDVFWIGRMGSAVALAAQGAANQVFQSAFWIISFMPSVIAPVVAKAAASGDTEEVQRAVGEAVFVASLVGLFGMALLTGEGGFKSFFFISSSLLMNSR